MNPLWLLLIPYCTLAFAIHGGEFISGINRQARNLICALPFFFTTLSVSSSSQELLPYFALVLAYLGTNLGFDWFPNKGWKYYGGLAVKGFITFPLGGFIALPLAYWIGYKTKYTNESAEYLSGTLYGIILTGVAYHGSI